MLINVLVILPHVRIWDLTAKETRVAGQIRQIFRSLNPECIGRISKGCVCVCVCSFIHVWMGNGVLEFGGDRFDFATTTEVQMPPTSFSRGMLKILRTEKFIFERQPGQAHKKYYNSVGNKCMYEPDISVWTKVYLNSYNRCWLQNVKSVSIYRLLLWLVRLRLVLKKY